MRLSARAPGDVAGSDGYRICARCVMDTTDPDISFDERGACNHCRLYDSLRADRLPAPDAAARTLERTVSQIRRAGRTRPYDCIIGLSGGIDSSFLALEAVRLGLRPLAVHLDNGWDSESAVRNIESIVTKLDLDLYTHVVDWEEFRDLQLSFFEASVVDIELLTDNAIAAILYRVARDRGSRYILSGSNFVTELIMPPAWIHRKGDARNIKAIHSRFGTVPLKTFPTISTLQMLYHRQVRRIRIVQLLDLIGYDRRSAAEQLEREIGWRSYGGKHHESLFTRFYQAYILPVKFGIDKRRAHLSTLICSGQLTRREALEELRLPAVDPDQLESDRLYVIKKLGLTEGRFEEIMGLPIRDHRDFPTEETYVRPLARIIRTITQRPWH